MILAIGLTLTLFLAITIAFGAPFVPTLSRELEKLPQLVDFDGVSFIDIGSGDGRVVELAAMNGATESVGIEINPLLWLLSVWRLRKIHNAHIKLRPWQLVDFDYDMVYIFATKREMINKKLAHKIRNSLVVTFGPRLAKREGADHGAFRIYAPVAPEVRKG